MGDRCFVQQYRQGTVHGIKRQQCFCLAGRRIKAHAHISYQKGCGRRKVLAGWKVPGDTGRERETDCNECGAHRRGAVGLLATGEIGCLSEL